MPHLFKSFLSLLLTGISVLSLSAQPFTVEGITFEVHSELDKSAKLLIFNRCMKEYALPDKVYNYMTDQEYTVTRIATDAFSFCKGLENVDLSSVEVIEDGYVERSADLRLTKYHGAFCEEKNLMQIDFRGTQAIGDFAFKGCTKLTDIDLKETETIGRGAFYLCNALEEVDFGKVKYILDGKEAPDRNPEKKLYWGAFSGCSQLQSIDLPYIEHIGAYAFYDCTALRHLSLGSTTKELGLQCFGNVKQMVTLTLHAPVPPLCAEEAFTEEVYQHTVLQIPFGTLKDYQQADGWKRFQHIVEIENTGIENVSAHKIAPRVSAANGTLRISGISQGDIIQIFSGDGRLLRHCTANSSFLNLSLAKKNLYLVQIGHQTFKVQL